MPPGGAAQRGELIDEQPGLRLRALAELGPDVPGRVEMHGRQREAALQRPLHEPHALRLLQRHHGGDSPDPADHRHREPVVVADGQEVVAQWRLPPGPARRAGQARHRGPDGHRQQEPGLVAAADRQQGLAHPGRPVGAVPARRARHVHLEPAPLERPPQQRLDHPHRLHPLRRDGLGHRPEQAAADPDAIRGLRHGEAVHG
jgi:hypothetical protein